MTRVLVVEDQVEGTYLLRSLLEAYGFEVDTAKNGAEALQVAERARPDLVVSDLLMPVMDGYTLLRRWKSDDHLRGVPFVVYTATYTDPADEKLAHDLGADAFIVKPAEPEVLLERLNRVLAGERSDAAPSSDATMLTEEHTGALIRKLEKRAAELAAANRALVAERAELLHRDRVLRAVSQGIVVCDARAPDLPIVYVSPSFARLTGYDEAEVLGRNCRFLQGPETDPASVAEIRAALRDARDCDVQILNYRKDGTPFWNALSISPVIDDGGAVTHFVGVQTDVTERHALEAQLRQAQKMEAVGQLAAGVAHDFNNLLSVILTYTELAMEAIPPGTLRDDLAAVRTAGNRAAQLTRQLLAFSRQQVLTPRAIDVEDVLREAEGLLRRALGETIELRLHFDAAGATIHADRTQLEQVIMNLVVNARDAMPDGGALTIETEAIDIDEEYAAAHDTAPGRYVVLSFTDTGVGMTRETQDRIFEPFFTTKGDGRGTGLGLSTVFGIVKQSRGHVTVYSELDHGTAFRIYLPRTEQPAADHAPRSGHPSRVGGSETVLVVEDEEAVRGLVVHVLARHGYHVIEARDGEQALERVEQAGHDVHLLVTDVVMPRMTGGQLALALRERYPRLAVIYMSGYTRSTIVQRGVADGTAHFLSKPITPSGLLDAVRQALDEDPPRD